MPSSHQRTSLCLPPLCLLYKRNGPDGLSVSLLSHTTYKTSGLSILHRNCLRYIVPHTNSDSILSTHHPRYQYEPFPPSTSFEASLPKPQPRSHSRPSPQYYHNPQPPPPPHSLLKSHDGRPDHPLRNAQTSDGVCSPGHLTTRHLTPCHLTACRAGRA